MRMVLCVLLAGCAGSPTPVVAPTQQAPAPVIIERCSRPEPSGADRTRRAELARELDRIDHQLDTIDDALTAAATADDLDLTHARVTAIELELLLTNLDVTQPPSSMVPYRLTLAMKAFGVVHLQRLKMSGELGDHNPMMIENARQLALLQSLAEQQRDTELSFAKAWRGALAAPDAVKRGARAVRLDALRSIIARGMTPTASPAAVRIAADRVYDATVVEQMLSPTLGPKHPDVIAATYAVEAARDELKRALGQADRELADQVAAPTKTPDRDAIARRGELAARAREIRSEYELHLER